MKDPWQTSVGAQAHGGVHCDGSILALRTFADVEPLSVQIGSEDRLAVPTGIFPALFGDDAFPEDQRNAQTMRTYAILDAARMPYTLLEMVAQAGAPHVSLFQGAAQEELCDYAPYLIQLSPDSKLTEKLFTGPHGMNGLWHLDLGIYLRSSCDLTEVRAHFRKLTRIQDRTGKWFYLGFYRPHFLLDYLPLIRSRPDRVWQWFGAKIASFLLPDVAQSKLTQIGPIRLGEPSNSGRVILEAEELQALERAELHRVVCRAATRAAYFNAG